MAYQKPNDPMAKVILVISVVVLLATLYVLISNLFKTINDNTTKGLEDSSLQMAAAEQNIKPFGSVHTVDKSVAPKVKTGDEVYTAICGSCHDSGALGAPKISAKEDWSSRVGGGLKALMASAINGKGQMPARGGDASLTDEEIQNAILYMTKKAGFDLGGEVAEASGDSEEATSEAASTGATEEPAAPDAPAQDVAPSAPSAPAAPKVVATPEGKKLYKGLCFSCHDSGIAGAPKLGDVDAWGDRIAQGMDTLYANTINGKGAMPAKGGNPALTDDEIKLVVDFMIAESKGEAPSEAPAAPAAEEAKTEEATSGDAELVATAEGEKLYKTLCFSCHDMGIAGSPKVGDAAAWTDRIAQGMDTLYANSINGKGAMPAKGGNPSLSDDEVKAAVDYMIVQSK